MGRASLGGTGVCPAAKLAFTSDFRMARAGVWQMKAGAPVPCTELSFSFPIGALWYCCFFQDSNVKGLIAVVLQCLPAHASSLCSGLSIWVGVPEDGGKAYLGCGFATSDNSYSHKEFGTNPPRNQTCLWRTLPGPRTFLVSQEFSGAMVTVPP